MEALPHQDHRGTPSRRGARRGSARARRVVAVLVGIATAVSVAGCSATARVTGGMDDTVRQVRDRVETVARASSSAAEIERRIRAGESYTLLILDPSPQDIRSTEPSPPTVITSVRGDGDRVEVEMYTTGQASYSTGWFGDHAVNAVGCARLTVRAGARTTAAGTSCGDTVRAVFVDPWVEVRLRP